MIFNNIEYEQIDGIYQSIIWAKTCYSGFGFVKKDIRWLPPIATPGYLHGRRWRDTKEPCMV
jgi:hypothetical protein